LVGHSKNYALQALEALGLSEPNFVYDFNIEVPADKIFAQEPAAKTKITKTSAVTIYISKGENPEGSIPGVIGLTEADASNMLKSAGYKNIMVILEESDKEIDKVFAQVPESGTVYAKSSEVVIKISKGIKVPDVMTMKKSDAISTLESLGFVVNILPDAAAVGKVKTQAPTAGIFLNYGSVVTIEIDAVVTTDTTTTTDTSAINTGST